MRPKLPKLTKFRLNKVFELLTIIVLIIALILVIYYIKFNKVNDNENFSLNLIEVKSNFYDITNSATTIRNLSFPLASSNVCIYQTETVSDKERVKEMECITAGELSNAIRLPKFRKEHICIDEECLGYNDLQILNGDTENKFKLSHHSSDRGPNASHTNCLAKKRINFVSCSDNKFTDANGIDGVLTLGLKSCEDDNINYYTIHDTNIDYGWLKMYKI